MGAWLSFCALNADALTTSSSSPRTRPARLADFVLLASMIIFCLIGLELGIRVLRPQKASWLAIYKTDPDLPYVNLPNHQAELDSGEASWTIHTDENGFRIGTDRPNKRSLPVVLWLGDSFTFANAVNYEESFVGLLNAEPRSRFYFANAGVGGWGPTQYRQQLESLLRKGMKPAEVLVGTFLGNDFYDCVWDKNVPVHDGVAGDDGSWRAAIKRHSHLYRAFSALYHRHAKVPDNSAKNELDAALVSQWERGLLQEARIRYREEFERMAKILRQRSIPLTVVIFPSRQMVDGAAGRTRPRPGTDGEAFDPTLPVKIARRIFDELGLRYLDATEALRVEATASTYFHFDQHLTPRGHQIVERAILRARPDLLSP